MKVKEVITRKDLSRYMREAKISYADLASELGITENTVRRLATEEAVPLPKRYRLALRTLIRETVKEG